MAENDGERCDECGEEETWYEFEACECGTTLCEVCQGPHEFHCYAAISPESAPAEKASNEK